LSGEYWTGDDHDVSLDRVKLTPLARLLAQVAACMEVVCQRKGAFYRQLPRQIIPECLQRTRLLLL
jgi:hypothetical protein